MTVMIEQAVGPDFGFGLYVHWPYCARICPYCDFNVYINKSSRADELVSAICSDIRQHREILSSHGPLDTIYFGGGTPSLLRIEDLDQILHTAAETFGIKAAAEISLEANPNNISEGVCAEWASLGINRLSIGAQSFNNSALDFLGRDHDAATARSAVNVASNQFQNISLDMIYARPDQSLADWERELASALELDTPHLSLYELTIEGPTAFGKRVKRGELTPLKDDDQADLYELTQAMCDAAGRPAYEVSNHASSPQFQSRHNQIYWSSGDWIGVGPGAHGRLTHNQQRFATLAPRRPDNYIETIKTGADSTQTALNTLDITRELIAMALRSEHGLDVARLTALSYMAPPDAKIEAFKQNGVLYQYDNKLSLTQSGRLLADYIAAELSP